MTKHHRCCALATGIRAGHAGGVGLLRFRLAGREVLAGLPQAQAGRAPLVALDDIRPERWDFTEELLELLWVLEETVRPAA